MKTRFLKGLVATVILILVFAPGTFAQWEVVMSKDEMTGAEIWYAQSPIVGPVSRMDFPYHLTEAWLGIGCDGQKEWVYVGFTDTPNLVNTKVKQGYSLIPTRIKWDEQIEEATLMQEWGSKFIHFDDRDAVAKITKSNTLLLELNWYGQGKVYFRFPLDAAPAAVKKMRAAFP